MLISTDLHVKYPNYEKKKEKKKKKTPFFFLMKISHCIREEIAIFKSGTGTEIFKCP